MTAAPVPRRSGAKGGAALRFRRIELIFQRFPGTDAASGIAGLDYSVAVGGVRTNGRTAADGKVAIDLLAGATAVITILGTEYHVTRLGSLEAPGAKEGIQRRLQMLGYYNGAVDGDLKTQTEYAVLNFQADNAPLLVDGLAGPLTQNSLKGKVGE